MVQPASNALLEAALLYASMGWHVVPLHTPEGDGCSCHRDDCGSIGKHPRTQHGLKDATVDPEKIISWWSLWPTANVGIVTGGISGLVVVDVDPRNGGTDSLAELESHGTIPSSVEALTGGGGRHILLAHPGSPVRGDNRGALGPGIDVKADGGYIVAPPSLHASGRTYEWEASSEPGDVPLSACPPWLLARLTRRPQAVPSDAGAPIPEGARNSTLASLAGTMRRRGFDSDAIEAALLVANAKRCSPPLSDGEVSSIAKSVGRYEPGERPASRQPAQVSIPGAEPPRRYDQGSFADLCDVLRFEAVLPGPLSFDELMDCARTGDVAVTDAVLSEIRERIERIVLGSNGKPLRAAKADLADAVVRVALARTRSPVAEYLNSLVWDGEERLGRLATELLGASTPLEATLLRRWIIGACARALRPGCKLDTVLILCGAQGTLKSSFFRTLTGPAWFTDSDVAIGDKDGLSVLQRFWVVEWAELTSMLRARDTAEVKAFLSRQEDTYRPPYGRLPITRQRHCVIVGTTNETEILTDSTGNRRYQIVRTSNIDLSLTAAWRDQIWAEGVALLRAGEPWWLMRDESLLLEGVHDSHTAVDPWAETIADWLQKRTSDFRTADVLELALLKPKGQWTSGDARRVAVVLRKAGWLTPTGGERKWKRP